MNVKEKLAELLGRVQQMGIIYKENQMDERYPTIEQIRNTEVATYLIAYGVTVPQWISVDDKLPEFCVSVLARCFYNGKWRTLVCHTSKEHAGEWYTDEVCQWVKVTHWMPLPPELPKGE